MKFNVKAKALLSQLVVVGKAIAPKPSVQILSNFLFNLSEGSLSITGSDSDNVVTTSIPVDDVEGNGKFCIEAKRLTELLKAMPDCTVTFTVEENAVNIKHEKGRFNLTCMKGDEYPKANEDAGTDAIGTITLTANQILTAFDKVGFATGNDDLRPQLNGILWDITKDAVTFVATDTRVLGKYRNTQVAPGIECSFTLPSRAIPLVRGLIKKESNVTITITNHAVYFRGESFIMRTTKVTGKYPDYNRVIPQNPPFVMEVDRNDLADAVDRVSICADSQHSLLRFRISPLDVLVSAQDISFNIGGSESVVCSYAGEEMEIGFSATYIKGVLNAINTPNVIFKLCGPTRPCVCLPSENDEFGELTIICVPMILQNR